MKHVAGWITFLLSLGLALPVYAADAPPADKADAAEIPASGWSNGAFLGPRWWMKNPKKLKSVPHPWLYHMDLNYSFSEQSGNIDAKSHRGKANLYLRKGLLSSITAYHISERDTVIKLTDKQATTEDESFRQGFRYPLRDNLSVAAGYLWEKNSGKYIDQRNVFYGGLRFHAINTKEYDVMFGLFYAPETETSYMSNRIREKAIYNRPQTRFPDVEPYSSDATYLAQRLHWQINDVIGFHQSVDYLLFLEDTSYYSLKFNVKLDFKFSKHTSFFVSYLVNYDNNSFVEFTRQYLDDLAEAGAKSGEMETTDSSMNVGVKFSF